MLAGLELHQNHTCPSFWSSWMEMHTNATFLMMLIKRDIKELFGTFSHRTNIHPKTSGSKSNHNFWHDTHVVLVRESTSFKLGINQLPVDLNLEAAC